MDSYTYSSRGRLWCLTALLVCSVVTISCSARATSPVAQQQYEGNYNTAGRPREDGFGHPSWNYVDLRSWPPICHTGRRQSPISFVNVDPSEVLSPSSLQRLQFSDGCLFTAQETDMVIQNHVNLISVMFERRSEAGDVSTCSVVDPLEPSIRYYFEGLHFHGGSEHVFRNERPDVEMHIAFATTRDLTNPKRRELYIAVLLQASSSINSTSVRALRHMLVDGALPPPTAQTTCTLIEGFPLPSLLPATEDYLCYDGSLSMPPCTEDVRWVVMTSPQYISQVALGKLRDAMDTAMPNDFHRLGNVRPPQALNGRRIYRFTDVELKRTTTTKGKKGKKSKTAKDEVEAQESDSMLLQPHNHTGWGLPVVENRTVKDSSVYPEPPHPSHHANQTRWRRTGKARSGSETLPRRRNHTNSSKGAVTNVTNSTTASHSMLDVPSMTTRPGWMVPTVVVIAILAVAALCSETMRRRCRGSASYPLVGVDAAELERLSSTNAREGAHYGATAV